MVHTKTLDPLNRDIESVWVCSEKKLLRKKHRFAEIYKMSKKCFKKFSADFNEQSNKKTIISPIHFEKKNNEKLKKSKFSQEKFIFETYFFI